MKRAITTAAVVVLLMSGCGPGERRAKKFPPLPPVGAVLFRDSFDNVHSGWHHGCDRHSCDGYVHGRYRVRVKQGNWYVDYANDTDEASDAVTVTATVVQTTGESGDEVGIACLAPGYKTDGYFFGIGPSDGFVGISHVVKADDVKDFVKLDDQEAVDGRGAVNHIRADCVGRRGNKPTRMRFYVNRQPVAGAVAHGFKRFDGVGLYVYSYNGGTTAFFDDVVVHELKPEG